MIIAYLLLAMIFGAMCFIHIINHGTMEAVMISSFAAIYFLLEANNLRKQRNEKDI